MITRRYWYLDGAYYSVWHRTQCTLLGEHLWIPSCPKKQTEIELCRLLLLLYETTRWNDILTWPYLTLSNVNNRTTAMGIFLSWLGILHYAHMQSTEVKAMDLYFIYCPMLSVQSVSRWTLLLYEGVSIVLSWLYHCFNLIIQHHKRGEKTMLIDRLNNKGRTKVMLHSRSRLCLMLWKRRDWLVRLIKFA